MLKQNKQKPNVSTVREIAAESGYSTGSLAHYFRTLDVSLGSRQVAGLRAFAAKAAEAGAVPPLPPVGPVFFQR